MKRFLIGALTCLAALSAGAQTQNETDGRGLTIGLGVGAGTDMNSDRNNLYHGDGAYAIITPRVGYRFNQRWEAGAMFRFDLGDLKMLSIGCYGEFSCLHFDRFRLIVDAQAIFGSLNLGTGLDGGGPDFDYAEVGFVPGLAYNVAGTGLDVKLRYLFVGYNDAGRWFKDGKGNLGRGDWILDAGLRRAEIGVSYTF